MTQAVKVTAVRVNERKVSREKSLRVKFVNVRKYLKNRKKNKKAD